jgi:hypothetical protein
MVLVSSVDTVCGRGPRIATLDVDAADCAS